MITLSEELRKHIGFTGTKAGMSDFQKQSLLELLTKFKQDGVEWFHHGDCVGSDDESHDIAKQAGLQVAVHPPTNPKFRAHRIGDFTYPRDEYLKRDNKIVDVTAALIAAPRTMQEQVRSGTWYTIRYARKMYRPLYILRRNE